MRQFFARRWFLIVLVAVLTVGIAVPAGVKAATDWIPKEAAVALVLFLMAVSLDSSRLWKAFRTPWPALLAVGINYVALPWMAWGLSRFQATPDFQVGLIVAGCVPCTLASAAVWTRKAGGDDAVALLVTLSTNLMCFVVTPMWLVAMVGRTIELDALVLMRKLALTVLTPTVFGQLLRMNRPIAERATRWKTALGVAGQSVILLVVLMGAGDVGVRLRALDGGMVWLDFAWVVVACLAVHIGALAIGVASARGLGFGLPQQAAVAFASSQKTLPIGLLLTTSPAYFGADYPMSILPMVVYHVSQLVVDTFVAQQFASRAERVDVEISAAEISD